jgi:hypothetical protein
MAQLTRKEAREEAFRLLFETEFRAGEELAEIYATSMENRELCENDYIKAVYFGVHKHMEEIDACFAQLEVYCRMKEETAFAAACGETARKVEAMGEAHGLKWENFF